MPAATTTPTFCPYDHPKWERVMRLDERIEHALGPVFRHPVRRPMTVAEVEADLARPDLVVIACTGGIPMAEMDEWLARREALLDRLLAE